jgi:hypothetical protein
LRRSYFWPRAGLASSLAGSYYEFPSAAAGFHEFSRKSRTFGS